MRQITLFLSPLWRNPQIAAVVALTTFIMSGVGLVSPILSVYAATFSASATMAGMIITLFGIGRLIVNLPAGLLSQRIGHRPLLMAGPFILVVGSIVAALATNLETLLAARFVQGIGSGIYMTVSSAAIATLAQPKERGRLMALYQGGMLLGTGLGPAIGGFLASHFGYTAPFWAYAVVCTVALFIAWTSVDRQATAIEHTEGVAKASALPSETKPIIRDMPFLLACVINFGVFFTRTASQWQAIPLLAHQRYDMGVDKIGLALTMLAAMNFLTLPLTGALVDRYGARRLTFVSTIVTAIALLWIALGESIHMMWIGLAVLGIGGGLNGPATAAYAAEIVPVRQYGAAMGLMRTFGDAGFVFGPIMIGTLADLGSIGSAGGLIANAALMAIAGLIFVSVRGSEISTTPAAPTGPITHDSKKDQIA
ncbi:MFS transporter [Bosea thiooxidans]|nr:MFS transporter [Bosea sp. (in: a-proteobacteria)]